MRQGERYAVVTGANSGIGYETALELASLGYQVGLVCRNVQRGHEALRAIEAATGNDVSRVFIADLSLETEVLRVAREIMDWTNRLDVLVNNAGGYFSTQKQTQEGIEYTMALNHLGYFRLTLALMPLLRKSAQGRGLDEPVRIVNVSSAAHNMANLDFDHLEKRPRYRAFGVYGESKLANIYFTKALSRRLNKQGEGRIIVNALHPGFVRTGFSRQEKPSLGSRVFELLTKIFAIEPEKGAGTSIFLATSPDAAYSSGDYFAKRRQVQPAKQAFDVSAQERLWQWSLSVSPELRAAGLAHE